MTEFITAIDEYTNERYGSLKVKTFGFCELMHKTAENSDQPIPVTIPNRAQVSLDNKFDLITWVRWEEPVSYQVSDEWSYGKNTAREGSLVARIVIAHKVELGEDLVFDFVNNFPNTLNIPGFNFIFIEDNQRVDPNHEGIYLTELGKTVYEKHRFTWNLYVVNFTFQFMSCDSSDFRITETGDFRVTES